MRLSILLVAIFVAVAFSSVQTDMTLRWQDFKTKYGKTYSDLTEETKRFNIFIANFQRAKKMNAEHGEPYPFGITQFSDLTAQEFKAGYLMNNLDFSNQPEASIAKHAKKVIDFVRLLFGWY